MSITAAMDELREHIAPYVRGACIVARDYSGEAVQLGAPGVYTFDLRPPAENETEDEYLAAVYPFVLLRPAAGAAAGQGVDATENAITVTAVVGVRYPGEDMQGSAAVAALIDRVIESVYADPYTPHCRIGQDVAWQIDDGDTHPYYFGALTITVYDRTWTRAENDI